MTCEFYSIIGDRQFPCESEQGHQTPHVFMGGAVELSLGSELALKPAAPKTKASVEQLAVRRPREITDRMIVGLTFRFGLSLFGLACAVGLILILAFWPTPIQSTLP